MESAKDLIENFDSAISLTEKIAELRKVGGDLLTDKYNTDFNLIRWIEGYFGDFEESKRMFLNHLRNRRFYDIDRILAYPDDYVTSRFFPLGLLGETGKDNRFLVIEAAGRIDLHGLLKSIQISRFLRQRLKFQEKVLECIMEKEKATNRQSGVIYILDLDGLKFDPSLIPATTGPYLLLWTQVVVNYPELISKIIVINAPSFMPLLWRALSPFIPENTRNKIEIFSGRSSWELEILKFVDKDYLPKHWGGTLVDKNNDPMCRSKLVVPMDKIPKELYWKPSDHTPAPENLPEISISAGNAIYLNFELLDDEAFMLMHKYSERTHSMAIHFIPANAPNSIIHPIEWCPDFEVPGLCTVDTLKVKSLGKGIYRIKFGNEKAWFLSLILRCLVSFVDVNGNPVEFRRVSQNL